MTNITLQGLSPRHLAALGDAASPSERPHVKPPA